MKITNHNCETNEIEIVDANAEQIKQISVVIQDAEKHHLQLNERKIARQSALAKLAALGLTEEEIAAL